MSTETGYNRDALLAMLNNRIVEIKFHKADGDLRVLRGTLNEELLPSTVVFVKQGNTEHPNLVTVWDLDANGGGGGWRSIRTDRIVDVL